MPPKGDNQQNPMLIPMSGKWIPAEDGTKLGTGDFQTLTNMRYVGNGVESVGGMTKVNTTVLTTYTKIKSGHHFTKDKPAESHVLVQAFNSAETQAVVKENTTAIPNQGDFSATTLYTDTANSSIASWCNAPDSSVAYANNKEVCVWGGNEARTPAFLVGDVGVGTVYDYTKQVNNILDDSENVATLYNTSSTADANTMLLLHFEDNVTDSSPTTAHTVTNNVVGGENATFSSSTYKIGSYSAYFNGSTAYLTIPDNADFDFSGGTWTIDFYMNPTTLGTERIIYFQGTDATHYMKISLSTSNILTFYFINAADEVTLTSGTITNGSWTHVAVVENGDSYSLYINGVLTSFTSSAIRMANHTGVVGIGAETTPSLYYKGYLDEFRVSNSSRWTNNFTPYMVAYDSSTTIVRIGSLRPLKGVKFYVKTPNTGAAGLSVWYNAGGNWVPVSSMSDGTFSGSSTLAQTGSVTFTTTVDLAEPSIINNTYLYWYLFSFGPIDNTTTVSYVTLDAPFQPVLDLWDGVAVKPLTYYKYVSSLYSDEIVQVYNEDYESSDTTTYSDVSTLATSSSLVVGLISRTTALYLGMATANTTACAMTISYWNGSAWAAVTGLHDETRIGANSLAQPGWVYWTPPASTSEFKKSINGGSLFYYYKISFSATLAASQHLDYISSIPVPRVLTSYGLVASWQNRLVMAGGNQDKPSSMLIGGYGTVGSFSGQDTLEIPEIGDDSPPIAIGSLFTRYTGDFYDSLIIAKRGQIWVLDGISPEDYRLYKISDMYGCVAPQSFKVFPLAFEPVTGIQRHVVIWQTGTGVVLFDGTNIIPIDRDISNYFDPNKTECISETYLDKSIAFVDERRREYHLIIASGSSATGLNLELVYSVERKGWFKIDRTTILQSGIPVSTTNGGRHVYGGTNTGYLERLEYGNTFDGTAITVTIKGKDYTFPSLGWAGQSYIRHVKLITKAITTTGRITLSHFGDCATSASSSTVTCNPNSSTNRIVQIKEGVNWGNYTFHSFQMSQSSSDATPSFEPIGLALLFDEVRKDY